MAWHFGQAVGISVDFDSERIFAGGWGGTNLRFSALARNIQFGQPPDEWES